MGWFIASLWCYTFKTTVTQFKILMCLYKLYLLCYPVPLRVLIPRSLEKINSVGGLGHVWKMFWTRHFNTWKIQYAKSHTNTSCQKNSGHMAPASHKTPPYPQGGAHKSQGVTIADIQKKRVHHYTMYRYCNFTISWLALPPGHYQLFDIHKKFEEAGGPGTQRHVTIPTTRSSTFEIIDGSFLTCLLISLYWKSCHA